MASNTTDYNRNYRRTYDKEKKYARPLFDMDEYKDMQREAKKLGYNGVNPYIADLVRAGRSQQPVLPPELLDALKVLTVEMRRIGTNINQYAKHSNEIKRAVDDKGLLTELRKLDNLIRDYTQDKFFKP